MPETPRLNAIDTWVFDLDNTLYPPHANVWEQVDARIKSAVAKFLSLPVDQAYVVQKDFLRKYGTTLRGLMVEHKVDPTDYLHFVHDIDLTVIAPNPGLGAALASLPGRKLIFTNATEPYAMKVLDRLGITKHFEAVFDIHAAEFLPKPDPTVYEAMLRRFGVQPRRAAMFEDMVRNLKPAHTLGMTTAWVKGNWPWQSEDDTSHVHHVIDDLTQWLTDAVAALKIKAPAD